MTANSLPRQDLPVTRSEKDHPEASTNKSPEKALTGAMDASIPGAQDRAEPALCVVTDSVQIQSLGGVNVCQGNDGDAYIISKDHGNAHALRVGSKQANSYLRRKAQKAGYQLKKSDISHINEDLETHAELSDVTRDVWHRVAPFQNGVELDTGDSEHTHIRVTSGKVDIIPQGSETLFHRPQGMLPFVMPADHGDLDLLEKYVTLHPDGLALLKGWLGYTLAHPKVSTTNYVILVLQGDQGSGKTFLCKILQTLVDPSSVGVQTFPRNERDLVIAAGHSHLLLYDNLRRINPTMADKLCTASSGGALSTRRLYADAEQHVHPLHVAMVLNGIHDFIDQPDLAQRSLPLRLHAIDEKNRRSEAEMMQEFQSDLPKIFRGLLDLVAEILVQLPDAEVTSPERMIELSHWLAAMEKVDGMTVGLYQKSYSHALNGAMLDSLLENPLAAAMISFIKDGNKTEWSGTSTELLSELNLLTGRQSRTMEWPQNPIALSKRLKSLKAGLMRQGINVQIGRAHERKIIITQDVGT